MNIESAFEKLAPTGWSQIFPLSPIERAKRFVVPLEEDLTSVALAKALIADVVSGRQTNAGVRWRYSGTNEKKAACFDLAATFYHACFCAMRDIVQSQEPSIVDMWPCVVFDYTSKCHDTCRSLKKKRLPRRNAAIRTFYPPWHFGCNSYVSDSNQRPSRDFSLSINPASMQYYHNPIDVLVSQGLIRDFPGVDFAGHAAEICDLGIIEEGLTRS